MWIGATNLNGPMTWVNGKPLTYTSWASGQPASSKKKLVSMKCKTVYFTLLSGEKLKRWHRSTVENIEFDQSFLYCETGLPYFYT
jgi:hypothetical protein